MKEIEIDTNLDEDEFQDKMNALKTVLETFAEVTTETSAKLSKSIDTLMEKYPDKMDYEFLRSMLPKNFYIVNNKLANEMTENFVDKDQQELIVIKPSRGVKEVTTFNTLTYDDKNITFLGNREFTPYDRTVHNAVCSLIEAGNSVITAAMVYRAMNGMTESEHINPSTIEAVIESLEKSRRLMLSVDFTAEAKARNLDVKETRIESYLLNADKIIVRTGGDNVIEAYKINREPILYYYARLTKQILSVPEKLLDTKDATRNTEKIIPIKEYLLRRIEVMKNNKNMSNKIAYDTIFKEAGIVISDKKQKDRLRSYIKEILGLWIIRDNYISNFKEYKERNAIKGIEIEISAKHR